MPSHLLTHALVCAVGALRRTGYGSPKAAAVKSEAQEAFWRRHGADRVLEAEIDRGKE